jgi:hypothetical protein
MGRRTAVLDQQARTLTHKQTAEREALEVLQTERYTELESILHNERRKQMDADSELRTTKNEQKKVARSAKSLRKKMDRQLQAALTGIDVSTLLEDGQTLSQVDPDTIIEALNERKEELTTELEDLKTGEADTVADNDMDNWGGAGGGRRQPVERQSLNPAQVKLGVNVRQRYQDATDDTPGRWLLEPVLSVKTPDTTVACRNLSLEYIVYGKHLTREDTYVMYFRGVRTFDLPAGAAMDLQFNKVSIGRNKTDPTNLDARYDGYIVILRDETGNILHTRAKRDTFDDVDPTGWSSLARGDIFDLGLGRNGRVPGN